MAPCWRCPRAPAVFCVYRFLTWIYRINTMAAILELHQATKRYGGVPAIENVDFTLMKGEIHDLCGENGAGKSTLTKVMAGVVELSECEMRIDGISVSFSNPVTALSAGVAMVIKENHLCPTRTITDKSLI